jgi:hypothetical protein
MYNVSPASTIIIIKKLKTGTEDVCVEGGNGAVCTTRDRN